MKSRGVVYVAIGRRAIGAVRRSIRSLKSYNTRLPVVVVSNSDTLRIDGADVVRQVLSGPTNLQRSRRAKLGLLESAPQSWNSILYLDADTEVKGSLIKGFQLLETGWDLVIAPSTGQGQDLFHHIDAAERSYTVEALLPYRPLQLQAGVMFIRRSHTMTRFFGEWRDEWSRFKGQDQAALVRALDKLPIRICLVSHDYNGGSLVKHHFGQAR